MITAEDLAPYGRGEPDEEGWYPDYRPLPEHLKPEMPSAVPAKPPILVDGSIHALTSRWRLVIADLALHFHVDLYDPAVLARPWPGVRTMIFSLLDQDTRLRAALIRR